MVSNKYLLLVSFRVGGSRVLLGMALSCERPLDDLESGVIRLDIEVG